MLEVTRAFGFELKLCTVSRLETLEASLAIVLERGVEIPALQEKVVKLRAAEGQVDKFNSDFINIILVKISSQVRTSNVVSSI